MATRIRLRRMGSNKRPFYRVVVADQRRARDGRFIENIGRYQPLDDPSVIEIDADRALYWLRNGAQPSNTVRVLMTKLGIWETFVAERPGAMKGVKVRGTKGEDTKPKPKLSKKAKEKAAEAAKAAAEPAEEPVVAAEPEAPGTPEPEASEASTEESAEA
jgi:small subunit ribosomal protein S16